MDTMFYLTHPGVYRKRLITTSLTPENIVQYTHHSRVPGEMDLFLGMLKASDLLHFLPSLSRICRIAVRRTSLRLPRLPGFMLRLDVSTLSL
jgi:hypothetical protein